MDTPIEQDLVLEAQQGDPVAFEQLIIRHERKAYNLALWLIEDPAEAEAALCKAIEQVIRDPDCFRGTASFPVRLFRSVLRQCLPTVRHRESDRPDGTVRQPVAFKHEKALQLVLRRMPASDRATIVLRDILGCSYRDLAEILECPVTAVRSRVHRARVALRANCQLN